jgi:hypothetical protein
MKPVREARIRLPLAPASAVQRERTTVLAILVTILLLQLELVFNRPVNWDEFFHLSLVHAQAQGRMGEVLQVLHVRALGWIAELPLDEIGQVRTARLAMLGCELFTLVAIYALARRFAHARIARLAPLLYLAAGNVFQHGMSFRADPLVTALLMGALWLLCLSKLNVRALAMLALLLALGIFATLKAALYAPAFAALAWHRLATSDRPRNFALRLAATAFAAAALFAAMVALSQHYAAAAFTGSAEDTVRASREMLLAEGPFPRWQYVLLAIGTAPIFAIALSAALPAMRRINDSRTRRVVLAGLLVPLLSVVFYRNAFPYFYAFILAPVAVGMVPGIAWLARRYTVRTIAGLCLIGAVVLSLVTPRAVQNDQRDVLRQVHRLFPQPVAYFDFAGMVAAFPKANVFMSTWGQTRYRNGESESYRAAVARQDVPLLLANNEVLARNQSTRGPAWELLPADAALLRSSYVPHWGPIWVAGHRFAAGAMAQDFELPASGSYTLESSAALIDDQRAAPGQVIMLAKGRHRFAPLGNGAVLLRWGDHLPRPAAPAPYDLPFKDF